MNRDETILSTIREALAKSPGLLRVELTPLGDPAEERRITQLAQREFPNLDVVFAVTPATMEATRARGRPPKPEGRMIKFSLNVPPALFERLRGVPDSDIRAALEKAFKT